jgi:hypothetical protein
MTDGTQPTSTGGRKGASVLKTYFGLKPGQTLQDFVHELKALPDDDYWELHAGITNETHTY